MQKDCLLKVDAVSVSYGRKLALDQISLAIKAGETLGLLGLNGAGKSTLLRLLAGLSRPHQGVVTIAGRDINSGHAMPRAAIGYAPDRPPVYPDYTVTQFLSFAARLRRIPNHQLTAATDTAIERCGLGDVRTRIIGNLSHGYQQRLNMAQALVHQPRLLLLDEPLNGLDPAQIASMRDILAGLDPDRAIIYSSHQLNEVQATCHRAVVLHNGRKLIDSGLGDLGEQDQTTVEIQLEQNATSGQMQALPGVLSVSSLSPGHWFLTTSNPSIATLREALQARHISCRQISPVRNNLERVFNLLSGPSAVGVSAC